MGKATLDEKNPAKLAVTEAAGGELINAEHAGDLYTDQKFGDGTFEIEFMIPRGSNSGVYLMGEYEIQILDSLRQGEGRSRRHGRPLQHRGAQSECLQEARRVAEVRHRLPGAAASMRDKKTANVKFVKVDAERPAHSRERGGRKARPAVD